MDQPSLTPDTGPPYRFVPVTAERAGDLDRFSRAHGKFRYCSCMRWRLRSAGFGAAGRDGRIAALASTAAAGQPLGVLAYAGDTPVGWCSIAPRDTHQAILASRVIPAIPADPSGSAAAVWSVTCFFLAPSVRGSGLLPPLLEAACGYAAGQGATVVEAYPWPGGASYRYMGTRDLYLAAGFREVTPPAAGQRPVMRRLL